eukprot:SAG31_NODE_582_length_13925_cov_32.209967_6_plen_74_part_00
MLNLSTNKFRTVQLLNFKNLSIVVSTIMATIPAEIHYHFKNIILVLDIKFIYAKFEVTKFSECKLYEFTMLLL